MYRLTWQLMDGSRGQADYDTETAASKRWMSSFYSDKVKRVVMHETKKRWRADLGEYQVSYKLLRWANTLAEVKREV